MTRLTVALASLLVSCAIPVSIHEVDRKDPVKGPRYELKRPVFRLALRLDPGKTQYMDESNAQTAMAALGFVSAQVLEADHAELRSTRGAVTWTTIAGGGAVPVYCIRAQTPLKLVLRQEMTGKPVIYEARSRNNPGHWFADSEITLTLDDKGALTAITAGETDKALEFLQAVAGLALSAAKVAALADGEAQKQCLLIGDPAFKNYVDAHIELVKSIRFLQEKILGLIDGIDSTKPSDAKHRLEAVALLRAELLRQKEREKGLGYDMRPGTYDVLIEGQSMINPQPANPWIRARLTPN